MHVAGPDGEGEDAHAEGEAGEERLEAEAHWALRYFAGI